MKNKSIHSIYNQSLTLLTDFYELTMAYGYWKIKQTQKESVFHLFFRRTPFQGGFTIATGLESVIDFIQNFHFDASDLSYLETLLGPDEKPYFDKGFLDYLSKLKFTGQIDAVPEGTVVFPFEPILRVQGPLIECQILESSLLNLINFPTLIATKAARVCLAAKGEPVMEFGLRRAQGIDGALTASRAAYIGGCESTSNVLAGKLFNIPVKGTLAHSWVMVFDDELESFKAYAEALPNNCVFLVDTYDTMEGVKKAIEVGHWLKDQEKKLLGIRLDSGDLADLSIKSRLLLDQAGFKDAYIVGSNELDETIISELKRQGAQINVWGVGTNLVTGKSQAALDGVYKLSAVRNPNEEWKYKLKLSEQMTKVSNPGILQVKRFYEEDNYLMDVLYDIHSPVKEGSRIVDPLDPTKEKNIKKGTQSKDLLIPIFDKGKLVYQSPSLKEIRDYTNQELSRFHVGIKRFLNPHVYYVGMEKTIYDKKIDLIKEIRNPLSLNNS
jgi:nicotinate phosphoribosyltransferase